ncbi:MAG: hypothetical protein R3E58_11740 [Phycisphaerae bacterium]
MSLHVVEIGLRLINHAKRDPRAIHVVLALRLHRGIKIVAIDGEKRRLGFAVIALIKQSNRSAKRVVRIAGMDERGHRKRQRECKDGSG